MQSPVERINLKPVANRIQRIKKAAPPIGVVDSMADRLVNQYKNQTYRPWYCNVVYILGPTRVEELMKRAETGNYPEKLFSRLAKEEMVRYE